MNPIDPILNLAFAMKNNRGAYAVLLGAGISRKAEIPTAWEVKEDLRAQVKTVIGQELPDTTGYGELLKNLGKTQAERSSILRHYFEPNDDDLENGRKQPTDAHRTLARLMKDNLVRIVLTTNFDRLLEQALSELSVAPQVIRNVDSLKGAVPLHSAPLTIIQIHGDYLDTRSLNLPTELETYTTQQNELLDRIFNEYGLIICGWSATWDVALRRSIEGSKTKQGWFSNYWVEPNEFSSEGNALLASIAATPIKQGADEFFKELEQSITALEQYQQVHPLTVTVTNDRVRRMLPREDLQFELEKLLRDQTEIAYEAFTSYDNNGKPNELGPVTQTYYNFSELPLNAFTQLAWYGKSQQINALLDVAKRWTEVSRGNSEKKLPAYFLLYSIGVVCVHRDKWEYLGEILSLRVRPAGQATTVKFIESINKNAVFGLRPQTSGNRDSDPVSNVLEQLLRKQFGELIPSDEQYKFAFDCFEMLLAIFGLHSISSWFPHNLAEHVYEDKWEPFVRYFEDANNKAGEWGYLKQIFKGNQSDLKNALEEYHRRASRILAPFNDSYPNFADLYQVRGVILR